MYIFKKDRCEQGSNLRGKIPLDFESNALTTRPSQPWNSAVSTYDMNTFSKLRAAMAEWLRRWTWNPMGSSRAGSNPARSEVFFFNLVAARSKWIWWQTSRDIIGPVICIKIKYVEMPGSNPGISNLFHFLVRNEMICTCTCDIGLVVRMTPWRNGSASDSRSEGCVFDSRRGQSLFFLFAFSAYLNTGL